MNDDRGDTRVPIVDQSWNEEELFDREPSAAPEDGSDTPLPDTASVEAELADLRDRTARTLADFENYRKRVERERRDERRYASMGLLGDIVGVVDNLERALGAGGDVDQLKTGVEMTLRQLHDVLREHDVERLEANGQPFDPNLHEAVARHEDSDVTQPTVAAELQSGYRLYDRLIRPAIVRVAMPPSGSESGD